MAWCRCWSSCVAIGTTVRVDTTLVGFEKMTWQRGHQTLIFQATRKCISVVCSSCDSHLQLWPSCSHPHCIDFYVVVGLHKCSSFLVFCVIRVSTMPRAFFWPCIQVVLGLFYVLSIKKIVVPLPLLLCCYAATGHRVCDINHGEKTVWEKEFKITE